MNSQQQLEILAFTDPVCTWCWGSEPVLGKVKTWYGDQVRITPVMGGLVEDIRNFYDQANDIGGDPEGANAQIARHWLEASERHGMPVEIEGFRLFSSETVSTYPQNIAYKAVELCNPELAEKYLRRIREASAAEARETGRREVLIELASDVGVDLAAFISRLDDGSAERAFKEDLALTRRYLVRGFPTFLFRFGTNELLVRGYQSFNSMRSVIASLSSGLIQERPTAATSESILDFLQSHGRAAQIELATSFEIVPIELDELLNKLAAQGDIRFTRAGNGGFWALQGDVLACDATTGACVSG